MAELQWDMQVGSRAMWRCDDPFVVVPGDGEEEGEGRVECLDGQHGCWERWFGWYMVVAAVLLSYGGSGEDCYD